MINKYNNKLYINNMSHTVCKGSALLSSDIILFKIQLTKINLK